MWQPGLTQEEIYDNLDAEIKHPYEKSKREAIAYLEDLVTVPNETDSAVKAEKCSDHFSTKLDTAFVLPLLHKIPEFSKEKLHYMAQFVKSEKCISEYWNHKKNELQKASTQNIAWRAIANEVDDTCKAIVALHKTSIMDLETSKGLLQLMLDVIFNTDENVCGDTPFIEAGADMDIMANIIYCAGSLNLDDDSRLQWLLKYLKEKVESIEENIDTLTVHGDKYFLVYLLSRAVSVSKVAKEMFGETLAQYVRKQLVDTDTSKCDWEPVAVASLLLAGMCHRFHEVDETKFSWSPTLPRDQSYMLSRILLKQQNPEGFWEHKQSLEITAQKDNLYYENDAVITVLALSVMNNILNEMLPQYLVRDFS